MKYKLKPDSTKDELSLYLEEFAKERNIDIYTAEWYSPKGLLVVGVSIDGDVVNHWNYHPARTGLQLTHTTPVSLDMLTGMEPIQQIMRRSMEVIASLYSLTFDEPQTET